MANTRSKCLTAQIEKTKALNEELRKAKKGKRGKKEKEE